MGIFEPGFQCELTRGILAHAREVGGGLVGTRQHPQDLHCLPVHHFALDE
jgi:hypothetical protein